MSLAGVLAFFLTIGSQGAGQIVARSVTNTNRDWAAAPQYDFTERDLIVKGGEKTTKTYQVLMLDGSPYYKLIAENGQPLPAADAAEQDRKLEEEIAHRRNESPDEREKRIAEYRSERRQDHALMAQMARAFDYKLLGVETVNGRRCFVLDATPKPGYQPINRDTEVLKGMRGRMWIDAKEYQWVKVQAEVFRPVAFGLFIAHVEPGTEFILEQCPVKGNLWLPAHFTVRVKAEVLFFSHNSFDDETYWDYRPAGSQTLAGK
jgi:hypothetical protein